MSSSVAEIGASIPREVNTSTFTGLLTRAMVRGTLNLRFASWQAMRLSSSSPVQPMTTPARSMPVVARNDISSPSPTMTITDPSWCSIHSARSRSFSTSVTS